jgi:tripartite ATP-independent transporter DctM subunit
MELLFLAILVLLMASALASGYPVAFALPGSAILTIGLAALCGSVFADDPAAYFSQGGPVQWLNAGITNFRGVYWEVERDTLIAIPLFVFMGIMLQRSKIAEDLLVTMAQLFGPVPGGLGISVVFVGALLAATTGIVGATVVAMGLISLPAMLRNNYSQSLATGAIAASGTLGQIIPPSIVLIILADQLASAVDQAGMARKSLYKAATGEFSMPSEFAVVSTSAGDMFLGAFVPGLLLVVLYMLYIQGFALLRPKSAPPVPFEGNLDRSFFLRVLLVLVPPLALIFIVLGSIILGIATVNQAGAIGAAGATLMAGYRLHVGKKYTYFPALLAIGSVLALVIVTSFFSTNVKNIKSTADVVGIILATAAALGLVIAIVWSGWRTFKIEDTLRGVMLETAKTTSLVFIILLGAAMLTAAFRAFGGEELVRDFLTGLPGGFWMQFTIVMAVIFFLGFFLDFIEIAVVVVPIVAPILLMDPSANITAVWLGVMIGLNIQTSFLTPPFGFALFYLRGVAPPIVRTIQMYKGVIPFICLQLIALVIVAMYPGLVNYLPNRISYTSVTAPPPINPRLQYCMEQYVFNEFEERGDAIRASISAAKTLDFSVLPKNLRTAMTESFSDSDEIFERLGDIKKSEAALAAQEADYRPVHRRVRTLQRDIRKVDVTLEELTEQFDRLNRQVDGNNSEKSGIESRISELNNEKARLSAQMPKDWDARHKAYAALLSADKKARRLYRQTVDGVYKPVSTVLATIEGTDRLKALEDRINGLESIVRTDAPKEAVRKIQAVAKAVGSIAGARKIRSQLSKARSAIRSKKPKPEKAFKALARAKDLFQKEIAWRTIAAERLLSGVQTYEAAIRDTVGLRQQQRLPKQQALAIAACNADHRDLSLQF